MANAANINTPAARMRFTRLKKMLDGQARNEGAAVTTGGAGASGTQPAQPSEEKGKKRGRGKVKAEDTGKGKRKGKILPSGQACRSSSPMAMSEGEPVDDNGGFDDVDDNGDDSSPAKKQKIA